MEEKTKSIYLADLDYFSARMEEDATQELYLPMAMLYCRLEKYDEAAELCKTWMDKYPDHTQLKVFYARAMLEKGHRDEARETLYDAIMMDEDNYMALKLLGILHRAESNKAEAIRYIRAAYLKAPEDDELGGWLEELGVLDVLEEEALAQTQSAEVKDPFAEETFAWDVDSLNAFADDALRKIKNKDEYFPAVEDAVAPVKQAEEVKKAENIQAEQPLPAELKSTELLMLELEDIVNKAQFSNDSDYPLLSGKELSDEEVWEALVGSSSKDAPKIFTDVKTESVTAAMDGEKTARKHPEVDLISALIEGEKSAEEHVFKSKADEEKDSRKSDDYDESFSISSVFDDIDGIHNEDAGKAIFEPDKKNPEEADYVDQFANALKFIDSSSDDRLTHSEDGYNEFIPKDLVDNIYKEAGMDEDITDSETIDTYIKNKNAGSKNAD